MDTQITTPAQHSSMIELQKDSTYTAPDTESLCSERSDLQTVEKKQPTIAHLDEEQGAIEFKVVKNDQTKESMILLTGLKNLFQKQLPNMPKEYISRLAYDRNHVAMAVVRYPLIVVGGIEIRTFESRGFAEIVFCAIATSEQVKGYGSRLMTHLKDFVREEYGIEYFLTYADNYAIGYFKKQGFTTDITLEKRLWVGYIKDYEGGTIMQCTMIPKIRYLETQSIIMAQRKAVYDKIRSISKAHIIYPGITFGERLILDPKSVPGLAEAGWTPEMAQNAQQSQAKKRGPLHVILKKLIQEMLDHGSVWPFVKPVAGVPDYYEVIKEPMDMQTLEEKVDEDVYETIDMFEKDTQKIFDNCKSYNQDGTPYHKCAVKLEKFFKERLDVNKTEFGLK